MAADREYVLGFVWALLWCEYTRRQRDADEDCQGTWKGVLLSKNDNVSEDEISSFDLGACELRLYSFEGSFTIRKKDFQP